MDGVVSVKSNKQIISEILELDEAYSLSHKALENNLNEENASTINRFIEDYNQTEEVDW